MLEPSAYLAQQFPVDSHVTGVFSWLARLVVDQL